MIDYHKCDRIRPETWGAKPVLDPRQGDYALAQHNSDSFERMFADLRGVYGENGRYGASVFLGGWFPVCRQINVIQAGVSFYGHNPTFFGSGLKWIGPARKDQSMIFFADADFSSVEKVGFLGPKRGKMQAAIRAAWIPQFSGTQRRLAFRDIAINNPEGHFGYPLPRSFESGFLSGGPGDANGNNDFFAFDNVQIANCDAAITCDGTQHVCWSVNNFGAMHCDYMYHSIQGGQVFGSNWYASKDIYKSVLHCSGPISNVFDLQVRDMSMEHLRADAFLSSTASVRAVLSGNQLQCSSLETGDRDFKVVDIRNRCGVDITLQNFAVSKTNFLDPSGRHSVRMVLDTGQNLDATVRLQNVKGHGLLERAVVPEDVVSGR